MPQFAARVVLEVQKTNHTAAATVVEGMAIVNSGEDIWRLSEIPEINPEFHPVSRLRQKSNEGFHCNRFRYRFPSGPKVQEIC